jgi:radical SAM protein with 4Fe4S-binding SPASM domain
MDSKTFCIIPWAHIRIDPNGTLIPCCKISRTFPTQNINTLEDFDRDWWNSQPLRQLRQDLAQGVKTKYCDTCWTDEAAGKSSLRQEYNKRLGKHTPLRDIAKSTSYVNNQLPISLDLNLGNICNFRCMMCGPGLSSRIQTERKQHDSQFQTLAFLPAMPEFDFGWPDKEKFQSLFKQFMPNVKILELKGGEPLLIKDVISTIKSVEDKKNSVIAITTNGSVEFDNDFVDQLQQFQRIWLNVSVDGILEHGEYIRHGSHWPTVHNTIAKISKLPNCTFKISTVLQFYSSLTFPHIANYAIDHGLDMEIHFCHEPDFLSIHAMLPEHHAQFQQFIHGQTQQYPDVQWLETVKRFLATYQFDPVLHDQCREYTKVLDSVRHNALASVQALFRDA